MYLSCEMRVRLLRVQTAYSEGTGLSIPSCGVLGDGAYALLSHQGHVLSCVCFDFIPSFFLSFSTTDYILTIDNTAQLHRSTISKDLNH